MAKTLQLGRKIPIILPNRALTPQTQCEYRNSRRTARAAYAAEKKSSNIPLANGREQTRCGVMGGGFVRLFRWRFSPDTKRVQAGYDAEKISAGKRRWARPPQALERHHRRARDRQRERDVCLTFRFKRSPPLSFSGKKSFDIEKCRFETHDPRVEVCRPCMAESECHY